MMFLGQALAHAPQAVHLDSSTSGSPATDVKIDSSPASAEADSTTYQLTSVSSAVVPIVAIAVCASVFSALTAAASSHVICFLFIIFPLSLYRVPHSPRPYAIRCDFHPCSNMRYTYPQVPHIL